MDKMNAEQVQTAMMAAPDWAETGGQIHRTFQFKDFVEAMKFVNKVAEQAEADQHHPDVLIRWNKVTLTLSTHDAAGITAKDFALASKSDAFAKLFAPAAPPAKGTKKTKK